PLLLILVLLVFRLYLPTLIKNYVNETLAEIPGYHGHVENIDLSLWRGAYQIDALYLNKVTAESEVPFLNFPQTDISVQWGALFKGKIVSEIEMYQPQVTYVMEDQEEEPDGGEPETDDWTKALKEIVPLEVNSLEIIQGKLAFLQLQADPSIDLYIDQLNLSAKNLRNVQRVGDKLPSPIKATGVSIGRGDLVIDGDIDLMMEIPDMDISVALENADVTVLNDFTNYYAGLDFESGSLGVYSEVAIADGYMKGYVKPLLTKTKLIGNDDGFLKTLWEGFVGIFKFILKNQGTNTLATKVPIEGDLNEVDSKVWPTVVNVFKNAWIQAFTGEVDGEIEFKDALKEKKESQD
ncbi:MAG: DUF748 domain-containing protein, partial [Psychroflexus sp.]|nr:DUF748 domain-containing protein [Psychroflexus sp.]